MWILWQTHMLLVSAGFRFISVCWCDQCRVLELPYEDQGPWCWAEAWLSKAWKSGDKTSLWWTFPRTIMSPVLPSDRRTDTSCCRNRTDGQKTWRTGPQIDWEAEWARCCCTPVRYEVTHLQEGECSSLTDVQNNVTQLQLHLPWFPDLQFSQKPFRKLWERRAVLRHRSLLGRSTNIFAVYIYFVCSGIKMLYIQNKSGNRESNPLVSFTPLACFTSRHGLFGHRSSFHFPSFL